MRVAEHARAATLLVCDIDRGGAFAHLFGTHQLLSPAHRALLRGFVLNKFRGDATLLAPGPAMLEERTGVPLAGVLPMWRDHGLPEEDGVFDAEIGDSGEARTGALKVAIVGYPRISNLDELTALLRVPRVSVRWARREDTIRSADLLILPGSKHVAADLAWLRSTGLDAAILAHVAQDKPTLAICGGLQMLGHEVRDAHGVEGGVPATTRGLGALPLRTEYDDAKQCERGRYTFVPKLEGFWRELGGLTFDAYEIHHGRTEVVSEVAPAIDGGVGWQRGQTLAIYTHGLFENSAALRALFGHDVPSLDDTLDGLADFVDRHIGRTRLLSLLDARER